MACTSSSLPEYFWTKPDAPAAIASITASSSVEAVSISTFVSGSRSSMSRQASTPSFFGIITSMTMTAGRDSPAILTASSPSAAWATTSNAPDSSRTSRSPLRMMG